MEIFEEINKELGTNYNSNKEINWINISAKYRLSEQFIEKRKKKVNWEIISKYQILSETFIEKWMNRVDWNNISIYQNLSEKFIEKWRDKLNWINISAHQKLSEQFIESWNAWIDWYCISSFQVLSEEFIEKWKDKVDWRAISKHQKLSKSFIEKYKDKISLEHLKNNVLTQINIEKDWFIAFILKEDFLNSNNRKGYFFSNKKQNKCIKVKIYYKDLISTHNTFKFEIIREVYNYKICGKRDGIV